MADQSCKTPRWRSLKAQLNNLSPKDFQRKLSMVNNAIVVDCRTEKEFESGHLVGAINISYLSHDFWDQIEQLDASKNIFVYCRTGRRSIRACTLMRNGGFDNARVFNMEGGLSQWKGALH